MPVREDLSRSRGVLVLEDGLELQGRLFGARPSDEGRARDRGYGEVVFNTSMTGYQEILTDPSYYGQIVCLTTAHVGNTGVNDEDPESRAIWAAGLVVGALTDVPSSWRATGGLDRYLSEAGVPGLRDVDTRSLTLRLRRKGVVRGVIAPFEERSRAREWLGSLPRFEGRDLMAEVTASAPYRWESAGQRKESVSPGSVDLVAGASGRPRFKVAAIDLGVKWNLLRSLAARGCEIEVLPASATAAEVLSLKPDGVFLSNGPGDPSAAPYVVDTVRALLGKVPIFGVCMGHQILALALGGKTYKMKFGHRGGNQPVRDEATGAIEISSHNHGYAVESASLPPGVTVTHWNLNDRTVEGLAVPGQRAFSVQYHPEACPGPHDSTGLFGRFIQLMQAG